MLLQKSQIGKTAVILIILILLAALAAMPLFLQADSTGKITPEANLFLPVIYHEADGTLDPVANATATPTFTASATIHPTITTSATSTPTSTPVEPYIVVIPNCGPGPDIEFNLQAYNWPVDQSVTFFWRGTPIAVFQANTHTGSFNMTWTFDGLSEGIYTAAARSGTNGATASEQIFIPCGILPTNTPTPTKTPTPTSTAVEPYIVVVPDCGPGPNIFFYVQGYNWPVDQSVTLMWNGTPQIYLPANLHPGHFSMPWTFAGMTNGVYTVSAISGTNGPTAADHYTIPCAAPN